MKESCEATDEDSTVVHLNYAGVTDVELGTDEHVNQKLQNAQYLYLKRNCIKCLPRSIGRVTHLKEIHLEGNSIEFLPSEIGELRFLQVLNVVSNYLTSLPSSVGCLTSLKKLQVSNNCIRELPRELGNLSELKTLEASRNQLTSVPIDLGRCSKLKLLALDKNSLLVFPRQLCWLKNLTELSLAGNKLEYMPPIIYDGLSSLESLVLDNNPAIMALPARGTLKQLKINIATNGLFKKNSTRSMRFRYKDGVFAVPEEFHDCVSCFPCLQEIALRRMHKLCTHSDDIMKLPLPIDLKETLCYPTAYCINMHCKNPLFRCAVTTYVLGSDSGRSFVVYGCCRSCASLTIPDLFIIRSG